jgi:hypothetical protein
VNDANMAPKLSIVPKLQKLILMLSSSRDGEVLAAAPLSSTVVKLRPPRGR